MWTVIASWFTPSVLFCLLNLTIGTIFLASNLNKHHQQQHHQQLGEPNSGQLVRVPSMLQRVKSINFSFYKYESDPFQPTTQYADPHENPTVDPTQNVEIQNPNEGLVSHVPRSKSEKSVEALAKVEPAMKKSASERVVVVEDEVVKAVVVEEKVDGHRPEIVRERKWGKSETTSFSKGDDEETVDAKADDFINRFRQQLNLQRLDSFKRYRDMLSRGAGR